MVSRKVSRRRFVASTAALSTAAGRCTVRARRLCRRQAVGRLLGPLGAERQRRDRKADQGVGREGKGRGPDRLHHLAGQQAPADHRRGSAGRSRVTTSWRMNTFLPARYAEQLVPVNDVMDDLIKENGKVNDTVEYLGKVNGKWLAVPATVGSQIKGPCSRIDLLKKHAGIDIQAMYPAGARAQGRRLDPRHLPQGGGSLPQGRQSVRHRPRHDVGQRRHDRRDLPLPSARCWSTPRATSSSRTTRSARRSTTTRS